VDKYNQLFVKNSTLLL